MNGEDGLGSEGGGVAGDFRSDRPVARHPMTWSLPLMQLGGVAVRMHAIFLLLIAVELLRSSLPGSPRTLGLPFTAVLLAGMVLLSVLHELVRMLAARWLGGDLSEWLLWPLGGLCNAAMEGSPRHRVFAAASPWLAQFALAAAVGTALWMRTGRILDGALPLPWTLEGFVDLAMKEGEHPVWLAVWLLQWWNLISLAVQALPAFPLTGGRVMLALIEARAGWSAAVRSVARAGLGSAVAVVVIGLAAGLWTLTLLALVLWIAARETMDRVQSADDFLASPARASESLPEQGDREALDRILAKIKDSGIRSLTWRERRRLKSATRRRRGEDGANR